MNNPDIIGIPNICHSFPELPHPLVQRDHCLDTIDLMFESLDLIAVEETQGCKGMGVGRTTTLALFALKYPRNTLCLFIKPTSRYLCNLNMMRFDLCNQIHWIKSGQELELNQEFNEALLEKYIFELNKLSRKECFHFVIDGLDDIPEEQLQLRYELIDMLPLGFRNFRFLISADFERLSSDLGGKLSKEKMKQYMLPPLLPAETQPFFIDLDIQAKDIEQICKLLRNIPSRLASLRRIFRNTKLDAKTFLEQAHTHTELFDIEWRAIDQSNPTIKKLLSIVAFSPKSYTVSEIATIIHSTLEEVKGILSKLGFMEIHPDTQEITFAGEQIKKFAKNKLSHMECEAIKLIINYLRQQPESELTRTHLPVYLSQAKLYDELLEFLSPEYFRTILEESRTLSIIQPQFELGVKTALELKRDGSLVRFSLGKSATSTLNGLSISSSEIHALLALGQYSKAIDLAQSALLKEDRLHLLAIVVNTMDYRGLSAEPELIDKISQLYSQIDWSFVALERASEIAFELVAILPELAIELIEKTTNTEENEHALDLALAKLSIVAIASQGRPGRSSNIVEEVRSKISDPRVRNLSEQASILIADYSSSEIISKVERLDNTSHRIYLLRIWVRRNRKKPEAIDIVEYALKLAIGATEFSLNASILYDLAQPFPYIEDVKRASYLVRLFDGQVATIEDFGPTKDYIKLQLLLSRTEKKFDPDAAHTRLFAIFLYIIELDDLELQAEGLARLYTTLYRIDKNLEWDKRLHEEIENELDAVIERLIQGTAEHYEVLRTTIDAVARRNVGMALAIADRLNTELRRNQAYEVIVHAITGVNLNTLDSLISVLKRISIPEIKDSAILNALRQIHKFSSKEVEVDHKIVSIIDMIPTMVDAEKRCHAYCTAFAPRLLRELERTWENIDVDWQKIDVGFIIAAFLAESSKALGQEWVDKAELYRKDSLLHSKFVANNHIGNLHLAIRALKGLLSIPDYDIEGAIIRLDDLVKVLPNGEKSIVWAELALNLYFSKRIDDCNRIVRNQVKPHLNKVSNSDTRYRFEVLVSVAPAIYFHHKTTALETLAVLPIQYRDSAYSQITKAIFRKKSPLDPYDSRGQEYPLESEDIVDLCQLAELIDQDNLIYNIIEQIGKTVSFHKKKWSEQQRADIATRVENLIKSKLPNPRHISHEGYAIIAQAWVERIRSAKQDVWENLITRAQTVPNTADQAYVLGILARIIMPKYTALRSLLLEKSNQLCRNIPAVLDKLEHFHHLSSVAFELHQVALAKQYLKNAMLLSLSNHHADQYSPQRRLIDLAYRIEPSLASSLVSMLDNDPARIKVRQQLRERVKVLQIARSLNEQHIPKPVSSTPEIARQHSTAAWLALGALNANKTVPVHLDHARDALQLASTLPLRHSYPIHAWFIENAVRRLTHTPEAKITLTQMFDATVMCCDMCLRLFTRTASQARSTMMDIACANTDNIVIAPNERERALTYIRQWIRTKVSDYLKICDPWFGLDDLALLQIVLEEKPDCTVQILTSVKHQENSKIERPWSLSYANYWKVRVSNQDPPDTDIVIVGLESSGKSPIHDRWWLTMNSGLQLGTSFNSLGIDTYSTIIELSDQKCKNLEVILDGFLQRFNRDHKGEKIMYTIFTLGTEL